jgi:type IV secretory pathway TraG/TraD family ATPase VirD4
MSIVQDLSQLQARYGPDRTRSIVNNHGCKMVLPGLADPETTELVSKLVGHRRATDVQVTRDGRGGVSRAYVDRLEPMATHDGIRQLDEGTAIALHRGRPPLLVRLQPWFRDRRLKRLAGRRFLSNAEFVDRVT